MRRRGRSNGPYPPPTEGAHQLRRAADAGDEQAIRGLATATGQEGRLEPL